MVGLTCLRFWVKNVDGLLYTLHLTFSVHCMHAVASQVPIINTTG